MNFTKYLRSLWTPEARLILPLYLLLLPFFTLLRGALLWGNGILAEAVPRATLLESFFVGLRFDVAIASYLLALLLLALFALGWSRGKVVIRIFSAVTLAVLLLGVAEVEFYKEFESRYNSLVFEYVGHPRIVAGMIWDGYPVLRYTLVWGTLAALFLFPLRRLWATSARAAEEAPGRLKRLPGVILLLALMVIGARGGATDEPLRWGDAFFSEEPFANHLALNGTYTLGRAAWDKIYSKQEMWVKAMPPQEGVETTRGMVLLPGEELLSPESLPLLRRQAQNTTIPLAEKPMNVVVILMESFSARYAGALGSQKGLTPEFDRLAQDGVLFERAFSSGTHTHQGVYSSLSSFPNLPGYEYLMKMMEANQEFATFPFLLGKEGYSSVFLYNGLFTWDNKEGFFRQHGMERFVGTADYVDPVFIDPVWGVSDYDVFKRANEEFSALAEEGPFFGAVLTLSNHAPFNLPEPLPFDRVRTGDEWEGRSNGMRYADWALGQFFEMARRSAYFDNTLFVVTGDHGFAAPPMITGMQLERFHVPLLFYAPGKLTAERRQTVASQVDILPSVLGLLGDGSPHHSWGRNLFSPALQGEGYAVIKPSGGEEKVAIIEGDLVLTVAPKQKPTLERFSLGFPPVTERLDVREQGELAKGMERRLRAFVQTGLLSLRGRALGLEAE